MFSRNWPEPEVRLELRASAAAMEEPARVGLSWREGALDGTLSLPDVAECRVLGPWSATARDVVARCREVRVESRLTETEGLEAGMEMELVLVPFRTDEAGNEVVTFAFRPVGASGADRTARSEP